MKKNLFAATLAACLMAACSKPATPTVASQVPAEAAAASPTVTPATTTGGVPARLCAVLRGQVPEVKGMSEIGARSQLVMAIGTAFDANATALATVSSDIDAIASAGCAEVRAPLLAATRAGSLQEAVR